MCYLIAKKIDDKGCIAVKEKKKKKLSSFTREIQQKIGLNGVQLVTISRPSAYGEYEPYHIVKSMDEFRERVLSM